jgi:hypothetical protein
MYRDTKKENTASKIISQNASQTIEINAFISAFPTSLTRTNQKSLLFSTLENILQTLVRINVSSLREIFIQDVYFIDNMNIMFFFK